MFEGSAWFSERPKSRTPPTEYILSIFFPLFLSIRTLLLSGPLFGFYFENFG